MSNFLTSTEFYVIAFTLAALLVGLIVRPRERGQAETTFASGSLSDDPDTMPHLRFRCLDNGDVIIDRYGLSGLTTASTVALAINRIGFDLTIEERVTLGAEINLQSGNNVPLVIADQDVCHTDFSHLSEIFYHISGEKERTRTLIPD